MQSCHCGERLVVILGNGVIVLSRCAAFVCHCAALRWRCAAFADHCAALRWPAAALGWRRSAKLWPAVAMVTHCLLPFRRSPI